MKQIAKFDELIKANAKPADHPDVSLTLVRAYYLSQHRGTECVDFSETIDYDNIPLIIKNCKEHGIDKITISSRYSSLTDTLWGFLQNGCTIEGMTEVPQEYVRVSQYEGKEIPKMPAVILKIIA